MILWKQNCKLQAVEMQEQFCFFVLEWLNVFLLKFPNKREGKELLK